MQSNCYTKPLMNQFTYLIDRLKGYKYYPVLKHSMNKSFRIICLTKRGFNMLRFSLLFLSLINLFDSTPHFRSSKHGYRNHFVNKYLQRQQLIRPYPVIAVQTRRPSLNQLQEFADATKKVKQFFISFLIFNIRIQEYL